MSDERLRMLEKLFRESGTLENEVAWLSERVRLEIITREKVEIAAFCGHDAAAHFLGNQTAGSNPHVELWTREILTLHDEGTLGMRIAFIAAYQGLPNLALFQDHYRLARKALVTCANSLQITDNAPLITSDDARDAAVNADLEVGWVSADSMQAGQALRAAAYAGYTAVDFLSGYGTREYAVTTVKYATDCMTRPTRLLKQAICDSLIPWALGYSDPLVDLIARLE